MHWAALALALCVHVGVGRRVKLSGLRFHDAQDASTLDGKRLSEGRKSAVPDAFRKFKLFALSYNPSSVRTHARSDRVARSAALKTGVRESAAQRHLLGRAGSAARLRRHGVRPALMTDTLQRTLVEISNSTSQVDMNKSALYTGAIALTNFSASSAEINVSTHAVVAKNLSAASAEVNVSSQAVSQTNSSASSAEANARISGQGKRRKDGRGWRGIPAKFKATLKKLRSAPLSGVGLDGGDSWIGMKKNRTEIADLAYEACSTIIKEQIIPQYYPARKWLWAQWSGTIIRRTLPREVLSNVIVALTLSLLMRLPGAEFATRMEGYFAGVARAWTLSATMASFMLSFFLSQSYTLWRTAYTITRRIQGRLNDIGLLCSQFATRNATTGRYTEEADELLALMARYVRLFSILFYASVTSKYASLRWPKGLKALVAEGALTKEESDMLSASAEGHNAVLGWMMALVDQGVADGRLSCGAARATGTSPMAVQTQLNKVFVELRGTYASLQDQLAARMPLAYVQLVQILTDFLMLFTPFALVHSVGAFGCVMGTAVVTLFHSSIATLAKLFLDPMNNEVEERGGDPGIGGISVATLMQETNRGSERWRKSVTDVPEIVFKKQKENDLQGYEKRIAALLSAAPVSEVQQDDAGAIAAIAFDTGTGASIDITTD